MFIVGKRALMVKHKVDLIQKQKNREKKIKKAIDVHTLYFMKLDPMFDVCIAYKATSLTKLMHQDPTLWRKNKGFHEYAW